MGKAQDVESGVKCAWCGNGHLSDDCSRVDPLMVPGAGTDGLPMACGLARAANRAQESMVLNPCWVIQLDCDARALTAKLAAAEATIERVRALRSEQRQLESPPCEVAAMGEAPNPTRRVPREIECAECRFTWLSDMLRMGDDRCPRCDHLQPAASNRYTARIAELEATVASAWAVARDGRPEDFVGEDVVDVDDLVMALTGRRNMGHAAVREALKASRGGG